MAIQFARIEIVSRSSGGNSCCKGAYNARSKILDVKSNVTYNFSNRGDNVYHEVLLPEHADKRFVDISVLMNEIEKCERRKDSQLLKDAVIALPDDKELDLADRIKITKRIIEERGWVKEGLGVQVDIHQPHDGEKNWHAHLLITTRRFTEDGQSFGMKARDLNPEFKNTGERTFIVPEEILLQHDTRDVINNYFMELGFENRVDMISQVPQEHIGPVRMRSHLNEAPARNEERRLADIESLQRGGDVLDRVTREMSVFSARDLQRAVKCIADEARAKHLVKEALDSKGVIPLFNEDGKSAGLYTTHEVRAEEAKLMRLGEYVNCQNNLLYNASTMEATRGRPISKSQSEALDYLLSYPTGLKVLKGRAGTGKSHVLGIVADVAKNSDMEVLGLAPTHKAKLELQSLGYDKSDTVKGFLFKLHNNRVDLPKNSLIVVDEAAMVGNSDYSELMRVAVDKKCNVILAGDERQLASISRGGMFEVYADYFRSAEMSEIRRQEIGWSRDVASALSKGEVRKGVNILKANDRLTKNFNKGDSIITLVDDWSKSSALLKDRLILAVKNTDVDAINKEAREKLIETGYLKGQECCISWDDSRRGIGYLANDRIVFQETNKTIGVNNGDFGTIKHADNNMFKVELDRGESVSFNPDTFYMFRHGYASTVYKAQGATISDIYVLHDGFSTLKNSYVAMSRHVTDLHLYTNMDATKDEWSLVQQLQFSPERRASINYHTQEDLNHKEAQGFNVHRNFLHEVISKACDFVHDKVTEFMDKKTVNHEYYKLEQHQNIHHEQQAMKVNQQQQRQNQQQQEQEQTQSKGMNISMGM